MSKTINELAANVSQRNHTRLLTKEGPNLLTTVRNLLFPILERLNCVAYVVHTHVASARFIAAKLEAKSMPSAGLVKLRATDRTALTRDGRHEISVGNREGWCVVFCKIGLETSQVMITFEEKVHGN